QGAARCCGCAFDHPNMWGSGHPWSDTPVARGHSRARRSDVADEGPGRAGSPGPRLLPSHQMWCSSADRPQHVASARGGGGAMSVPSALVQGVIKRNGAAAVFRPDLIRSAIARAGLATGATDLEHADAYAEPVAAAVLDRLAAEGVPYPHVEHIQDLVEQ